MEVFKPPDKSQLMELKKSGWASRTVFLSGSIEMGEAENWQERVSRIFTGAGIFVLNPRRDGVLREHRARRGRDDQHRFAVKLGYPFGIEPWVDRVLC